MRRIWILWFVGLACATVLAHAQQVNQPQAFRDTEPAPGVSVQPGMDIVVGVAKATIEIDGQPIASTLAGQVFPAIRVEKDWIWIEFGWLRRSDVLPFDTAVEYFTPRIQRQPTVTSYLVRGAVLSRQGEFDKALADFEAALKLEPRNPVVYLRRGQVRLAVGQDDQALADYTQALSLDPVLIDALITRGSFYCDHQAFQEGIRDYTAVIKLAPRDARGYLLRATAWGELKDADQELADASAAIKVLPSSYLAYTIRAGAYQLKGDNDRALVEYTEALRLKPDDIDNLIARAWIWEQKGDLEKSLADLNQAIEFSPYDTMALTNRGWIRVSQGKFSEAMADFDKTIELGPMSAGAWGNKAWLLATGAEDRFRNGSKALEAAIEACELTEWKDSHSLEVYAAAKAELGDFEEAVQHQTKAVELSPSDLKAKAELRLKLYQEGKPCRGEAAKP